MKRTLYLDNHRLFVRPRWNHPRRYPSPAKVIPLHYHLDGLRQWRAAGSALMAIVASLLFAAMLFVALRTGNDVMGRLAPQWPWW